MLIHVMYIIDIIWIIHILKFTLNLRKMDQPRSQGLSFWSWVRGWKWIRKIEQTEYKKAFSYFSTLLDEGLLLPIRPTFGQQSLEESLWPDSTPPLFDKHVFQTEMILAGNYGNIYESIKSWSSKISLCFQ
jgi:hypothetical protein